MAIASLTQTRNSVRSGTSSSAMASPSCPKCGIFKKSGRHSCCARGGGWFKNCGDEGDTKFDHSWSDGIQVCKGFGISLLVKSEPQAVGLLLKRTQLRSTKIDIIKRDSGVSDAGATQSSSLQDYLQLAKVAICVILHQLQV